MGCRASFELNCLLSILDINGIKLSDSFDFTDGSVVPSVPPALVLAEGKDDDERDGSGVPPVISLSSDVALLEIESSMDAADAAIELYKQEERSVEVDCAFLDFVDCEILEPKSESTGKLYSSKFILFLWYMSLIKEPT